MAAWWLLAFKLGLRGLDPVGGAIPGAGDPDADEALEHLALMHRTLARPVARVVAGDRIVRSSAADEPADGPPASAGVWTELGLRLRAWLGRNHRETRRVFSSGRATGYRPPPLDDVVAACAACAACGGPFLYHARLMAGLTDVAEPDRWGRLRERGWYPSVSPPQDATTAVWRLMHALCRELTYTILGRPPHPWWRREYGRLEWNGTVCKEIVVGKATKVVRILDQFEADGWPDSIPVPLEWDGAMVHQTLKSLNEGLERVRFRANGGGWITWEVG